MKVITGLQQGSAAWHEHRRNAWNASDAPAMLDESPYCTRAELLRRLATGIAPEVDDATQRRFDAGHRVEALLRKRAEEIIGEPLHPFVGVADFDERYSASFDGCTFVGDELDECKLLNARLRAAFADMERIAPEHRERSAAKCLPIDYRIQMEQQARIAGAARVLFLTGELREDDTLGDVFSCWYYPDDALWARIQAGWPQFQADRAAYAPPEVVERVTAAPIESLPAVSVRMDGALAVISNLDVFGAKLREFVTRIPAKPSTEQEFADCAAAVKALEKAEEALDAAEANALGQVQSVEELTRTIATLREVSATARKATRRIVEDRKTQIRLEQVQRGREALAAHIAGLNQQLGKNYMPAVAADFGAAISGRKTVDSLRNAIDTELARAKIAANEIAGTITLNLNWLREHAAAHTFLFADTAAIVLKAPEDLQALATNRINAHKAAEERRLEAERDRIRAEEQAKAEKAAREKLATEQREAQEAEDALIASIWESAKRIEGDSIAYIEKAIGMFESGAKDFENDSRPRVSAAVAAARAQMQSKLQAARQREADEAAARQSAPAASTVQPPAAAPIAPPALSSQAANVVQIQRQAPAVESTATIRLGQINERLAPIHLSAEGLAELGFEPVSIEKPAKNYRESDFGRICDAIVAHVRTAQQQKQAA